MFFSRLLSACYLCGSYLFPISFFSESALDEAEEQEEPLDEETKLFNFWTHQLHIFFVRKYFPAAQKMSTVRRLVAETLEKRRVDEERMRIQLAAEAQAAQAAQLASAQANENLAPVSDNEDLEGLIEHNAEPAPSEIAVNG